ncbi:MAG: hypothetical protein HY222_06280 [Thaumarchaeota archaeon]|nr:hypothetical protein [Nitrososphaerota archaeon]MBI3641983.1 hypothetical protein [Nitrososphaerota archaeon]
MSDSIKYENIIKLDAIPVQWIPRFELFLQDLPNFPLVYVHFHRNNNRVFGFPVSVNFTDFAEGRCRPEVRFLSNKDLDQDTESRRIAESELSERFGLTRRVTKNDIIQGCNGDKEYERFFSKIWDDVIKTHHGDSIPYGRYYEELYSIVRFVAAWNTAGRGGRQQELRQLYWFLREYGNKIKIEIKNYDFYLFFLLPTYNDVKLKNISDFPRFENLMHAIEKIWNLEFTNSDIIHGIEIKSMRRGRSWPNTRDEFVRYIEATYDSNTITPNEAHELGILVDMFDRFPKRAAGFIWCVMSIYSIGYEKWDKEFLDEFYLRYFSSETTVGIYPKVVSCFLQQGFANEEAVPMDNWILSFANHPLGILGPQLKPDDTQKAQNKWELEEFFKKFKNRAKLERLIWLLSQSKKVNMEPVFDMLWCIRFGTTGDSGELRGQNPISCYQCNLHKDCKGYATIKNSAVWIHEGDIDQTVRDKASKNNCDFVCITRDKVPKKIERIKKSKSTKKWLFVDEFSGLRMKPDYTTTLTAKQTVGELVKDLDKRPFSSSP